MTFKGTKRDIGAHAIMFLSGLLSGFQQSCDRLVQHLKNVSPSYTTDLGDFVNVGDINFVFHCHVLLSG